MWSHLPIDEFHRVMDFMSWGLQGYDVQFGKVVFTNCFRRRATWSEG
jgi:hypothetical protein